jgi:hypothetical protein
MTLLTVGRLWADAWKNPKELKAERDGESQTINSFLTQSNALAAAYASAHALQNP